MLHAAGADASCPPPAGQHGHSALGRHSRLLGDIGKHLSMLSELVERELSAVPPSYGLPGASAPEPTPPGVVMRAETPLPHIVQGGIPRRRMNEPNLTSLPNLSDSTRCDLSSVLQTFETADELQGSGIPARTFHSGDIVVKSVQLRNARFSNDHHSCMVHTDPLRKVAAATRVADVNGHDDVSESDSIIGGVDVDATCGNAGVSDTAGTPRSYDSMLEKGEKLPIRRRFGFIRMMTGGDEAPARPAVSRTTAIGCLINELQAGTNSEICLEGQSSGFRGKLQAFMSHIAFEASLACAVVANAFLLGLQVDQAISGVDPFLVYRVMDVLFSCIFLLELCMRLFCEQLVFIQRTNPNFAWNLLDSGVIITSFVEEALYVFSVHGETIANVSVLRLLRVLRVVRLLRTVKLLRYFRDLRVMILGIFGSMKSLTWAVCLLTMLMYLTSVLIVDTLSSSEDAMQSDNTMELFGGVSQTLLTLFLSVLGGIDWGDAMSPLLSVNVILAMAFALYVSFSILCVLNIVTGVFVENANRMTAKSDEEVLVERLQLRKRYLEQARDIIRKYHPNPFVNAHSFVGLLRRIEFQAILRKLDVQLEAGTAESVFTMIDFDGSGSMEIEELMNRLDQLHGGAKSIDILRLMHTSKAIQKKVEALRVKLQDTGAEEVHSIDKESIRHLK
eukprot:TRINITY_DN17971_c0_g1_i1.p1 TRINITY_DN17971_c0_g1~~TRINITY_DN17971_c0_g1_i1.p1  ORF type:complete len:701 (-),score=95.32 TRINITY_DN17971_c0_g1_i1:45-2069(-)